MNTDTIGTPVVINPPVLFDAPAGASPVGDYLRGYISGGTIDSAFHNLFLPDVSVSYIDNSTSATYPASGIVKTNVRGEYVIPRVSLPPQTDGTVYFTPPGTTPLNSSVPAGGGTFSPPPPPVALTEYIITNGTGPEMVGGELELQDGSPCGTVNEFFGVEVVGSASLLDAKGNVLFGPVRTDQWGDYALPYLSNAASVSLGCEAAASLIVPITNPNTAGTTDLGVSVLSGITPPTVTSMSVSLEGLALTEPVAIFLPPPTGLPSDIVPLADAFLAEKGLDSRLGACQYYKAVGAVQDCDNQGNFMNPITFEDWKNHVKIGEYATSNATEFTATYINKVDLNLTRNHHSISYGPANTAAYVCNYLGPKELDPAQSEIDTVVQNAVNGQNLVACVTMDYAVTPNVNGGNPFIRFLIFSPGGQLLPSVNLDGRREKFVPGTCVVCHGGDHYAGKFPEDGTGFADVGGRFLPYDSGNFAFSSAAGLKDVDQEPAIYQLNQNVLNAGPTQAEIELINGWYADGKTLNQTYLPASWQGTSPIEQSFYLNVHARSCRTCHVSLEPAYSFENYANITPTGQFFYGNGDTVIDVGNTVCGGTHNLARAHKMPNSLVTFNRFWLSSGKAIDMPAITDQFINYAPVSPTGLGCVPGNRP